MEEEEEVDDVLAEETRALLDPDFVSQEIGSILDCTEIAEDDLDIEETLRRHLTDECSTHP